MVASAAAGHSKFLLKRWDTRTKWGKIIAALVLFGLQGKGYERKEVFLVTSLLVTLWLQSKGPPAAKSGYTPCKV